MASINLKSVTDSHGLQIEKSNDKIIQISSELERSLSIESIIQEFKSFAMKKLHKNKEKVIKKII